LENVKDNKKQENETTTNQMNEELIEEMKE
jgi:hypothetical protein